VRGADRFESCGSSIASRGNHVNKRIL